MGLVMQWSGENLILWASHNQSKHTLSPTAALIWLLCDGRLSVVEIKDRLSRLYPDQVPVIDGDVSRALGNLQAWGLLDVPHNRPLRPLIRVGFCNFWPGFDTSNNYFLWMLTYKCDVMLVDPRSGDPDLIFYSIFPPNSFDHSHVDRSRT